MRNIKIISLLILVFTGNILFAQSIDEGKRFLYYERYNSAKDVFSKLVNANPGNADAAYWLGQTYLGQEDINGAKAVYQKALGTNPNSPLLLVAMGHIALLENQNNDARNRFETALSLSKGKDYNVINAIARANVDAKAGDALYAIEKIKAIPENKRTAEIWTTLGDAYRKLTDGANSTLSYQSALAVDPNYARANFMIGRIYETQGKSQEQYYMKYYNEAIAKDAKFAPAYYWLYNYYYLRDVNKSREYLDKFIAVADADSKNCSYQASILYASKQYQQAITKINECITAGGQNPYPNLYGLKAFAYDKLGDSANAKTFIEMYFQKQNPEKLLSGDYALYGRTLLKFPGNEAAAANYIQKAIALDTLEENKIDFITSVANSYIASKNYNEAAQWYTKLFSIKKNITKTDIYNSGYNYYRGGNYRTTDSTFALYTGKYSDDILGWYMRARANEGIDSTGALGLAKPHYEKVIQIGEASTDKEKIKSQLFVAYNYMIAYYYNIKKDKATALMYVDKILAIDPTNQQALDNKKALMASKVKVDDNKTKIKSEGVKEKVTPGKTKVKEK